MSCWVSPKGGGGVNRGGGTTLDFSAASAINESGLFFGESIRPILVGLFGPQ